MHPSALSFCGCQSKKSFNSRGILGQKNQTITITFFTGSVNYQTILQRLCKKKPKPQNIMVRLLPLATVDFPKALNAINQVVVEHQERPLYAKNHYSI